MSIGMVDGNRMMVPYIHTVDIPASDPPLTVREFNLVNRGRAKVAAEHCSNRHALEELPVMTLARKGQT